MADVENSTVVNFISGSNVLVEYEREKLEKSLNQLARTNLPVSEQVAGFVAGHIELERSRTESYLEEIRASLQKADHDWARRHMALHTAWLTRGAITVENSRRVRKTACKEWRNELAEAAKNNPGLAKDLKRCEKLYEKNRGAHCKTFDARDWSDEELTEVVVYAYETKIWQEERSKQSGGRLNVRYFDKDRMIEIETYIYDHANHIVGMEGYNGILLDEMHALRELAYRYRVTLTPSEIIQSTLKSEGKLFDRNNVICPTFDREQIAPLPERRDIVKYVYGDKDDRSNEYVPLDILDADTRKALEGIAEPTIQCVDSFQNKGVTHTPLSAVRIEPASQTITGTGVATPSPRFSREPTPALSPVLGEGPDAAVSADASFLAKAGRPARPTEGGAAAVSTPVRTRRNTTEERLALQRPEGPGYSPLADGIEQVLEELKRRQGTQGQAKIAQA